MTLAHRDVQGLCMNPRSAPGSSWGWRVGQGLRQEDLWQCDHDDSIIITAKISNVPGRGERTRGKGDIVSVQSRKGGKALLVCLQN